MGVLRYCGFKIVWLFRSAWRKPIVLGGVGMQPNVWMGNCCAHNMVALGMVFVFSLLRSCFPAPCPRVAAPCHFATLSLHYAHTNNHILSHCPRNDLPPQCHCNTDIADFSKLFLMSPAPGPCVAAGYCCICSAVPTVHVSAPSFRSPLFPASCPRDAFAALCSPMSRMFPETS